MRDEFGADCGGCCEGPKQEHWWGTFLTLRAAKSRGLGGNFAGQIGRRRLHVEGFRVTTSQVAFPFSWPPHRPQSAQSRELVLSLDLCTCGVGNLAGNIGDCGMHSLLFVDIDDVVFISA